MAQKNGIVLNRMYAGSYLSANIGHEVINMFCDDKGRHFMYLNATGDFAADKQGDIGSMLLIKYIGQDEAKHPWVEVLGLATDLMDVYIPDKDKKKQDVDGFKVKAYDETGKDVSIDIDEIKYGDVSIRDIFKGSSQQDILITYSARKLYVPQKGTRVFRRYKEYNNCEEKTILYATSKDANSKPDINGYRDNIKMDKPCYLWKTIKNDEGYASLVFKEKSYVIELENTKFASTSLKRYIDENNADLKVLKTFLNINLWVESNKRINKSEDDTNNPTKDSIFDICCLEYNENCFSNALAYFMDKYREEWKIIFEKWLGVELKTSYRVEREINIQEVIGKGGRIDLLIQDENNLIIIENKIKSDINSVASDLDGNQLDRYKEFAKKISIKGIIEIIKNKLKENYINFKDIDIKYADANSANNKEEYKDYAKLGNYDFEYKLIAKKEKGIDKEIKPRKKSNPIKGIEEIEQIIIDELNNTPSKNHILVVLSPEYNQPQVLKPWKSETYKNLKDSIDNTCGIDNLINDNNFKSFLDAMERHTKANLSDWLRDEMLKKFKRVIKCKKTNEL